MIRPVRNKKLSVRKRAKIWGKGSTVDYEINLRAMMAAFYCGTGGADIAKALSFIGIPSGKSWEQAFTRHSPKMCEIISSVVNGEIRKSLMALFSGARLVISLDSESNLRLALLVH